ncbi:MAG: hypothetical protein JWN78_2164 [Bacteroidota bacterium]|nr:hypothetical protein [Bacteroidota bacterium]
MIFLVRIPLLFIFIVSFTICYSIDPGSLGFSKPVNLPFNLAGSFAEPREDHFHSGIDIKTNGVEGEPVFSIYNGYVSRILVSPYGYGRAIYITHTNGYTSVYGHLSKFNAAIEEYVHKQHYNTQNSELDLKINPSLFPVKQNDTIAFSGNTGGSTAPHLHFEIRNTKTEEALNPLDFYPNEFYVDTIPPQLNKVKIYRFDSLFYNATTEILPLKKENAYYTTMRIPVSEKYFCLSLEGFDKQDNSENKNGIKKIEVFQNNAIAFKYDITKIDFSSTRMCNAFVDYDEMMNDSGYFYNAYQLKKNTLDIYSVGNGFLSTRTDDSIDLKIYCYDYNENKTEIHLKFIFYKKQPVPFPKDLKEIFVEKYDSIEQGNFRMKFQSNTFFDDLLMGKITYPGRDSLSDMFSVYSKYNVALKKPAVIEITTPVKKLRSKIVIMNEDNNGKKKALASNSDDKKIYGQTRSLGLFYLQYDTTRPLVKLLNLANDSTFFSPNILVKIKDDLSGIANYNGYIDGHWVNFYYDAKNDMITYNFDEYCPKGVHTLKVSVTDKKDNETNLIQIFNNK